MLKLLIGKYQKEYAEIIKKILQFIMIDVLIEFIVIRIYVIYVL